ncbi:DUF6249 domain-containing protein [Solimonas marina]|uniref:DUF6249 domain-containing protein n=1 Tax=Solimonas marina TaxID=2714601 RepID=A0A969WAA6_9GAMM|nr:DUF6249 domain-containing protein [Solimonas marina]NKF23262.1 hypothetical protein [Solimonas marina]
MLNVLATATASLPIEPVDSLDVTGLTAVIMAFTLPAVLVIVITIYRLRQQRLLNEMVDKLIAAGQPVPPEILMMMTRTQRSSLSRALTMLGVGVAGGLALYFTDNDAWPWALVPLAVGVARLIAWRVEDRHSDSKGR